LKKLAVIAVLLVFMVNTMGYLVILRYNQYLIQQEMLARIRCGAFHNKILILKILHPEQEKQFRRIEKTEFTYFGKMYDVAAEEKSGDTTVFYCLHDKKEEDLLADYSIYLRRNGDSTHKDNSILAMLYNLITQALIQQPTMAVQGQGIEFHFPISEQIIIPVYLVHFAPPPETV
jgi:hypothetical protein